MSLEKKLREKLAQDVTYGYLSGPHSSVAMPTVSFNKKRPASTSVEFSEAESAEDAKSAASSPAKAAPKPMAAPKKVATMRPKVKVPRKPPAHSGEAPDVLAMMRKKGVGTGIPSGFNPSAHMGKK